MKPIDIASLRASISEEPTAQQLAYEYAMVDKKLEKANHRLRNFTMAQIREAMSKA